MAGRIARIFADPKTLQTRVNELGAGIADTGPDDLLLITMLHGGVPFLADLVRCLPPGIEVDFLRLSPYMEGERAPGVARIVKDLDAPLGGRHVLVVEDVIDTGLSLAFLLRNLEAREPASLRICTLLDRKEKRIVDLPIAFRGFEIGNEFIVGYGLDILNLYRNLPCLIAVEDLARLREDPLALQPDLVRWGIWPPTDTESVGH